MLSALLAVSAACGDDAPTTRFVDTREPDGGDGDGDLDDEDAGNDRKFYARFCENHALGTCTEGELEPLRECYQEVCHPQYIECDLPCSPYIKCIDLCDCEDRRCVSRCERPEVCAECLFANLCDKMLVCAPLVPECADEAPDYSCAELEACCSDIRGEPKADCERKAAAGDAEDCAFAYGWYCAQPN